MSLTQCIDGCCVSATTKTPHKFIMLTGFAKNDNICCAFTSIVGTNWLRTMKKI